MEPGKKSSNKTALRWLFERIGRSAQLDPVFPGTGPERRCAAHLSSPLFITRIIHGAFMENRSIDVLVPPFSLLVGIIILRALLGWAREVCGFYAGAQIRQEVRMALLEHIFSLGPAYTNRQSPGALTRLRWSMWRDYTIFMLFIYLNLRWR